MKAREQQAGADQQHERERHLRRHEHAAQRSGSLRRRAAPALFTEGLAQVDAADAENRDERDEHADHRHQEQREADHLPVERDDGALRRFVETKRAQAAQAQPAKPQTEQPADAGEVERFREQLRAMRPIPAPSACRVASSFIRPGIAPATGWSR